MHRLFGVLHTPPCLRPLPPHRTGVRDRGEQGGPKTVEGCHIEVEGARCARDEMGYEPEDTVRNRVPGTNISRPGLPVLGS